MSGMNPYDDELDVMPVSEGDLDEVVSLWTEAFNFMKENGIKQWLAEQVTRDAVVYAFENSEMFLVRNQYDVVGTFFLIDSDAELWGEEAGRHARYLHRLVVARRYAGRGVGYRILALAEQYLRKSGTHILRLDCMADNPKLNAFYQGAGFVFKGKVNGNGWSAHLYEKELL